MKIIDLTPSYELALGKLMVSVYSNLEGFPSPLQQTKYFEMLENIGQLNKKSSTHVFIAVDDKEKLLGGVVYFSCMSAYGSGGTATEVKNASGIRLLAVSENARGKGVGRELTEYCIERAVKDKNESVILHTTDAMRTAWLMYEKLGFNRRQALDFKQGSLSVYGFTLPLLNT